MKSIWHIITLIPEYRGRLAAIIAGSALLGLSSTAIPYLFKAIVDTIAKLTSHRIVPDQARTQLIVLLASFAMLRLGVVLFNYLLARQADALWLRTVSTLRQRVFDTMSALSIDYYERTRVGDVMDRYSTVTSITMWLFQLSEGTLAGILQLFFGISLLLFKAPLIGVLMVFVIPFNFFASFRTVSRIKPFRRNWHRLIGIMAGLLSEMVSQIATVRSFSGEGAIKDRFETLQREWWDTRAVEMGLDQRAGARLNLVNAAAVTASVGIVSLQAFRGQMTVGDILLVLTLTQSLITAVQPITRTINTAGDVDTSAERLVELLSNAPTVVDTPDARPLERIETIEFHDVSFAYPGTDMPSLDRVSFRVDAGEMVALVGPSGSGKSTLIKLLMRFYDPTGGEITINGHDIRAYSQESIRAAMGTVLQDVALFNDTIEDNIGFARPGASPEAIRAAAEAAHADAFIRGLPEGYMTRVGERGVRLSGGEKQRVAIARALLRDPQLIILDEATSALDSESERLVQEGLDRLMRGRTAIVIAHRLSTIAKADRILVLQQGRLLESGDHSSLLKRSEGVYAKLYMLQHGQLAEA